MKRNKNIIATLVLVLILGVAFVFASKKYYNMEREACFQSLTEYTSQLAGEIDRNAVRDREHLEIIANIITEFDSINAPGVKRVLSSFDGYGMMSRLEILLPDNRVLLRDGSLAEADGVLSFEEEAEKGEHISGRQRDVLEKKGQVLRSFVPVKAGGETIAVLCGVMELDRLPELFSVNAFGGNAQTYIIDGNTGDFLMDTWHDTLGNMEEFKDRGRKEGYSHEKISSDFSNETNGNTVFLSEKAGEYFYCYYEPVGINHWMTMVSVPEDIAFERVEKIMRVSYYLAAFEVVVFVVYFAWMLITVRKERYEKEHQLGRVQYMYEVQKLLFDVHSKPEHMKQALQKIAEVMTAEKTFLVIMSGETVTEKYFWEKGRGDIADNLESRDISEYISTISEILEERGSLTVYRGETGSNRLAKWCRNIIAVPVKEINGGLHGILGACNMKYRWKDATQLECVTLSFSMAVNDIQIYDTIRKMGMMDSLTGVLNRNSYHLQLTWMEQNTYQTLACVYLDANGLHEINNHLGHEAGDRMLQFIANEMKIEFGSEATFRIGGDEFVAICKNQTREAVERKTYAVIQAAEKENYFTAMGMEWRDSDLNMNVIVKEAEKKMQQDKRSYYEKKGGLKKLREMNKQLEDMITEKKDADAFLSVIASNFKGVYFVNLGMDSVRHIFIPKYFKEMLEKADGKFSMALKLYGQEAVHTENLRKFQIFCTYESLEAQLEREEVPELVYQKKNGTWLRLRVFRFKKYTEKDKETLWIFENIDMV